MAIIKRSTTTIIGLDTELAAVNANIAAEAAARQAADGALASLATTAKDNLVNAINEVNTAVSNEVTARVTQVGNLRRSNGIGPIGMGSEVGIANGFHNFTAINYETVGGSSATDYIANVERFVAQEANERVALANNLQQQITNILSNTDATALNSLSELVTAFQAADNNLNLAITTLADTASTNLSNEVTARTNADTEIKNALVAYSAHVDTTIDNIISGVYTIMGHYAIPYEETRQYSLMATASSVNSNLEIVLGDLQLEDTALISDPMSGTYAILNNFETVRTIIDGQAYDLSATLDVTDVNGMRFIKVIVSDLSSTDLALFSGKTFKISITAGLSILKNGLSRRNYVLSLANNKDLPPIPVSALKKISNTSTPWGALV